MRSRPLSYCAVCWEYKRDAMVNSCRCYKKEYHNHQALLFPLYLLNYSSHCFFNFFYLSTTHLVLFLNIPFSAMPLYSAAQTLPPHIVQSIISYVVWRKDVESKVDKIKLTAKKRSRLRELMEVCRHWRSIALPFYYYAAGISIYEKGIGVFNKYASDMLDLEKVSENKSQQHIQRFRIIIWSSALVKPEAAIRALKDTVKRYGPLKRPRTVRLEYVFDGLNQPLNSSNMHDATAMDILERICTEYAIILNELLPNKHRLVFKSTSYIGSFIDDWYTIHSQVPNYFYHLLGDNITSFRSDHFFIGEKLVDVLKKVRLKHLSVDYNYNHSIYIDLIRQISASLESLDLSSFPQRDISMMILPSGDSGVLIYPRLKKIYIDWNKGEYNNMYEQFESDPFPALEQFICNIDLNNGILAVLKMGNSHIRKLGLSIYRETMNAIESNNIFTAGSYSALTSIYIRLRSSDSYISSEKASRFIAMLLNMSPIIRHVSIYNDRLLDFDDAIFPDIVQSDLLRTLVLNGIGLTMDQIIRLASKFKNLDTLTATIRDYSNRGDEIPDKNEVQRWKNELKAYTSNVHTIRIESISFSSLRRGAEFVVLLASILQSVGRVAFKPMGRGDVLCNPLYDIESVLKRSVYKRCEHVHRVKFYLDELSWKNISLYGM